MPLARRIAYDPVKGRAWLICSRCSQWNLVPLDERWEVLEECEERTSQTRLSGSWGKLTLISLGRRLELLRIGDSFRGDIAGWRYARHLRQRFLRSTIILAVATVCATGLCLVGVLRGLGAGFGPIANAVAWGAIMVAGIASKEWISFAIRRERETVLRVDAEGDEPRVVRGQNLANLRITGIVESPGWAIQVTHDKGQTLLLGAEAVWALEKAMAWINRAGGSAAEVQQALQLLESSGSASNYLVEAAREMDRLRLSVSGVPELPARIRLALEMAAHDLGEMDAIRRELEHLNQRWHAAEEEAGISDELFAPPQFASFLARFRR